MFLFKESCLNCKISVNSTLKDAVEALEKGNLKIALVIDENNSLKGTVCDGDIRRALLKGLELSSSIHSSMITNYLSVNSETFDERIIEMMRENGVLHIPVISKENKFIGMHVHENILFKKEKISLPNSVLLMAGGRGKRLMPLTENCPKPLIKVNGKPILEIILEQCINAGIVNVYMSVHYLSNKIIDHFGDGGKWNVKINYLHEKIPLGTAGALTLLPENLKNPLLVMNGDVLTRLNLNEILSFHDNQKSSATICVKEHNIQIPYGVVDVEGYNLEGFVEKPTYKFLINTGVYIINPEIFAYCEKDRYLDMPELLTFAKEKNNKISVCPIHEYWIDIGNQSSLEKAEYSWRNQNNK